MVIIYTSAGCVSCRKAKHFLEMNEIPYLEKNIFSVLLDPKEISYLLARSENGTDDIISKRSKIISSGDIDIESMSMNELINFIRRNPSILKRPIIIDEKNLLIGYDEEEIESFLPKTNISVNLEAN